MLPHPKLLALLRDDDLIWIHVAIISFPPICKADGLKDFQSKFLVLWAAKAKCLRQTVLPRMDHGSRHKPLHQTCL
ncbi:latent-transforming growth factor beta-binding protein 2 [Grus japonensis]|uniref:Latent-transforming growth factor beta-binding protein 2 n=1 Tax=Grus japonensis TaxID=30415 RepID=A0ABC9WZW9_GRUJA